MAKGLQQGEGERSQSGSEANKCSNKVGERRLPRPQTEGNRCCRSGQTLDSGLSSMSCCSGLFVFSSIKYILFFCFVFVFWWLAPFLIRRVIYEIFSRDIQVAGKRLQRPSHTKHNSSTSVYFFWYFLLLGIFGIRFSPTF